MVFLFPFSMTIFADGTGGFCTNGSVNAAINDDRNLWAGSISDAQDASEQSFTDVEGT